ncbi:autotransporter secretion inner membrane protein TamB [Crenobacter luteus]|uniref:translocation/assembly module TamB domain-containing protein n=1 Tax=Crenobacter luteus TaxID=1452487 RepID=UPI00104BE358|nr:translocation/assembly module TamB domain-containing protein [Crenobacter luteus]TCP13652.1 autotransporter secretion inner membrane protein TamB [Crenobacter luteus]
MDDTPIRDDAPPPTPPQGETPPPAPRRRRVVRTALVVGFPVLSALLVALAWLTATPAGFATLTRHLDTLSGGRLAVAEGRGTLWDGFELSGLVWQSEYERVELDRVALDWRPRALWRGELWVERLALGHLKSTALKPSPTPPAGAPDSLGLPLAVRLDALTLQSVSRDGQAQLFDVEAAYRYRDDVHRVELKRLGSPWGRAGATLSLGAVRPFALSGRLTADGELEGRAVAAAFTLSSDLLSPRLAGTVTGEGLSAEVDGRLAPFAPRVYHKVRALDVRVGGVNPRALNPAWPAARLNLALLLRPADGDALVGGVTASNLEPGALSADRLPFDLVAGRVAVDDAGFTVEDALVQLLAGRVNVAGRVAGDALDFTATLSDVGLAALHEKAPADTVGGRIALGGSAAAPRVAFALAGRTLSADGRLALSGGGAPRTLKLEALRLGTGPVGGRGELALAGELGLDGPQRFALAGNLRGVDVARLMKGLPTSELNGKLSASGNLAAPLSAKLLLELANSRLSGSPLAARIDAALLGQRLTRLAARVALAENRFDANGRWGAPGDAIAVKLDAPALSRIGPGFAGSARGELTLSGSSAAPQLAARLRVDGLAAPGGVRAQRLDLDGDVRVGGNAPFKLALAASDVAVPGQTIDTLRVDADGNRGAHRIEAAGALKLQGRPHTLALSANGGLAPDALVWRGTVERLALSGELGLRLLSPAKVSAAADAVSLSATRFALAGGTVRLDAFDWRASGAVRTRGALDTLALARLEPWLKLPVEQNLVFAADWDLTLGAGARGTLALRRQAGDVVAPGRDGRKAVLELGKSELAVRLAGGRALVDVAVESRFATVDGQLSLAAPTGLPQMNAPMNGRVRLAVAELARLTALTGPGMTLSGAVAADLLVSGTPAAPLWRGSVAGSRLGFVDSKSGLKLEDGVLAAQIDGREIRLEQLRFAGGRGEVVAAGRFRAGDAGAEANAKIEFRQFALLSSRERRLVVSGVSEIALTPQGVLVSGRLRADRGRIDLPKEGAPTLSDDVVVKGRDKAPADGAPSLPITLALDLDLGDRFRLSGQGLNVSLTGTVRLAAKPGEAPTALGQVRVVEGRYKAYGQDLDIERGVITFAGPLDNPSLSVRAKRRLSPVGAGVEVTGTVSAPNVRLIADEAMSDKDKLAWLVLGRAASTGGGDDVALAASAGAFLAGNINDRVGLFDDLGLSSRGEKTYADGRVSPAEQILVVGKQLTRELFVGYEYGIRSAKQAFKFSYQFSKSWSVVLRAGNVDSSVETRFTRRFD